MKAKSLSVLFTLLLSFSLHAQEVEIRSQQLTDHLHMLQGKGGNIALSVGSDGTFMVDDQFAEMSEKIKAAVEKISPGQPVKFLLNTHWHRDHTGGNENFGTDGAMIIAHDNVHRRLKNGGEIKFFLARIPPANPAALPVISFSESMSLHWNGDRIDIQHLVSNAHTDGDSVVFFRNANVVHTGDLFFNGFYPFIDNENGGSVKGVIDAVNRILEQVDDQTKIIPGHGPLSDKAGLIAYKDMLSAISAKVEEMKSQGKSLEEVIAAKPSSDFDPSWGNGFIKPDTWAKLVYESL